MFCSDETAPHPLLGFNAGGEKRRGSEEARFQPGSSALSSKLICYCFLQKEMRNEEKSVEVFFFMYKTRLVSFLTCASRS